MPESPPDKRLEDDIAIHILSVSAAMVGVCLTVIGVIRVVITLRKADTFADDLLALDAILFLVAALSAYWALRTRSAQRMYRLERFADVVVLAALVLMVVVCAFIVYNIALLS